MKKLKVENSGILRLQTHKDKVRGYLSIAQAMKNIPFAIKRVYLIHKLSSKIKVRGEHAHKKLKQAMFCIQGSCNLHLDDGKTKQTVRLSTSEQGILLGPHLWHSMTNFSNDCMIIVLADDHYKESDYIRKYTDFLTFI